MSEGGREVMGEGGRERTSEGGREGEGEREEICYEYRGHHQQ